MCSQSFLILIVCGAMACACAPCAMCINAKCLHNFTILAMAGYWLRSCIPTIEPYRVHWLHTPHTHTRTSFLSISSLFIFHAVFVCVPLCVFFSSLLSSYKQILVSFQFIVFRRFSSLFFTTHEDVMSKENCLIMFQRLRDHAVVLYFFFFFFFLCLYFFIVCMAFKMIGKCLDQQQ